MRGLGWVKNLYALARTGRQTIEQRQRFLVPMRHAGMYVDHETALKYSAVWRCVNLISQTIATLPWHVFNSVVKDDRVVRTIALDNPVDWILHRQANPEMSALQFREFMLSWALLGGNSYAEIERDRAGRVLWLWPISPERVTPARNESGDLIYRVRTSLSETVEIPARDMYHLRGLGFDGLVGYSVISMAARSIALGLAQEAFGASFFSNGITPSGVLEHPKHLSDKAHERLKEDLKKDHGGPEKAFAPMILEEGMVWKAISQNPEEAQFLENRRYQVSDMARWFGVPLVLLEETEKATTWGSGIEQILLGFQNFTLRPWITRMEIEADIKLFGTQQRGRVITKMNMSAQMRSDMASRKAFYKTMWDMGVFNANDILELEDRNPIGPEGDKRFVPSSVTTIQKAGEQPKPAQNSGTDNGEDDDDKAQKPDEATRARVVEAQREVLSEAMRHIVDYESKKAVPAFARYRNKRAEFVAWMDKFFDGQVAHMRSMILPSVKALARLTASDKDYAGMVDLCIDMHIQMSRANLLDAFDSGSKPDVMDHVPIVDNLIEAVT